ncbi:MAG: hypothetical protein LBU66_02370, partial [Treponema sp.]|nr:hypothetical protein [Treponema sp.]
MLASQSSVSSVVSYSFRTFVLLILSVSIIFISCATVSPVDLSREVPVLFSSIESVKPVWKTLNSGASDSANNDIGYIHGRIAETRFEFWALRIDLTDSAGSNRIFVQGGAASEDGTLSTKVTSFVRDNNLLAGINTVPFDISSSEEGLPIRNMGIVISAGSLIAPINPRFDALVFYKNGTAAIVRQSLIAYQSEIDDLINNQQMIDKQLPVDDESLPDEQITSHPI